MAREATEKFKRNGRLQQTMKKRDAKLLLYLGIVLLILALLKPIVVIAGIVIIIIAVIYLYEANKKKK